jgi:hypothetical protein
MFFTATVPEEGRINLSPKGMDTFRCLDDKTVAYLNLTGSGNETAAHLIESGRITIMFCSYDKNPLILKIYGTGRPVHPGDSEWDDLAAQIELIQGARQYVVVDIDSVQTSCGYGVPRYEFVEERDTLKRWAEAKGEDGVEDYWRENNAVSIDGQPTRHPVGK